MKKAASSSAVMNWSASVLSASSSDSEPAFMITFDNAKYMFNAPENLIRSFTHAECNRKKLQGVFLTGIGSARAGGLAGLFMTLADASSINQLHISGPTGLLHLLASMRFYTFRDNLRISPREIAANASSTAPIYSDENVTVYGVPLLPETSEHSEPSPDTDTLKRKRESSPDQPRKRSLTGESSSALASDSTTGDQTLAELMSKPNFKPEFLKGEKINEWYRLLLQTTFPATGIKLPEPKSGNSQQEAKGQGKQKQKGGAGAKTQPKVGTLPTQFPVDKDATQLDDYRRARRQLPKGYHEQLPQPSPTPLPKTSLGYVVVGPRIRGKFDASRANALGVPNGPIRGQLTRGEAVTFTKKDKIIVVGEDGKEKVEIQERTVTVRPEECVGESEAPSVVVVVDVPGKEYIPAALQAFGTGLFAKLRSGKPEDREEYSVKTVFHLCGQGVLEDPRYVEFMNGFGEDVNHIVSSKEHSADPVTFTSAAFNQLRLNKLDGDMFPLQQFRMEPQRPLSGIPNLHKNTHTMTKNLKIGIRPFSKPILDAHTQSKDFFHPLLEKRSANGDIPVELRQETLAEFEEAHERVRQYQPLHSGKRPGDDVVVIPLGTGSAVPGRYRTVSSTLIQIPNYGNVLLDAGEGTYFQLARHFGEEGVKQVLRDIKCLYVSHVHADHHMGVPLLLRKRLELDPPPSDPLYLVSIRTVQLYLQERQQLEELGIRCVDHPTDAEGGVIPVMSEALHWRFPGSYQTEGYWAVIGSEPWLDAKRSARLGKNLCDALGLRSFSSVDVRHGTRCYGLVMKHKEGWSIAFSGDTEPCDSLVYAGKNATLLIHEATMADDQADLAKQKKHSTFGQAITIGKRMGAEKILMTHFSARHPKVPMSLMDMDVPPSPTSPGGTAVADDRRQSQRSRSPPTVALAFDNARLRIGDMWKMKLYLPAFEQNNRDTAAIDGEEDEEEGRSAMDLNHGF
ncbi:hypothetical protein FA15DRAFT_752407 [Coprinopsis marcescibilis]|uniref:ribonuclease Z n=1 Tax=Coprinopsis marcescibilis TaxID=230819 RepID=A0A5C3LB21_COPMA|nr:hypothetical protein FA15DRAFT_752407 [Coprinopsis marcescibilis]